MIKVTSLGITGNWIWTTAQSEWAAAQAGLETGSQDGRPYIVLPPFVDMDEAIEPSALPSRDILGAQGETIACAVLIPTTREEAEGMLEDDLKEKTFEPYIAWFDDGAMIVTLEVEGRTMTTRVMTFEAPQPRATFWNNTEEFHFSSHREAHRAARDIRMAGVAPNRIEHFLTEHQVVPA